MKLANPPASIRHNGHEAKLAVPASELVTFVSKTAAPVGSHKLPLVISELPLAA